MKVETGSKFQDFKIEDFNISRYQDFKVEAVSRFQGFKTSRFREQMSRFKISRFQDYLKDIFKIQDLKISRFQDFKVEGSESTPPSKEA